MLVYSFLIKIAQLALDELSLNGVRQPAIYDVAVEPDYQGRKIWKEIVLRLMSKTPGCNFILYATPEKDGFYNKFKFKKMKTAMAFFAKASKDAGWRIC